MVPLSAALKGHLCKSLRRPDELEFLSACTQKLVESTHFIVPVRELVKIQIRPGPNLRCQPLQNKARRGIQVAINIDNQPLVLRHDVLWQSRFKKPLEECYSWVVYLRRLPLLAVRSRRRFLVPLFRQSFERIKPVKQRLRILQQRRPQSHGTPMRHSELQVQHFFVGYLRRNLLEQLPSSFHSPRP